MKDYHDLLLMTREKNLIDRKKLSSAIQATFSNRGNRSSSLIAFDSNEINSLQVFWQNHLNGLGNVIDDLNLPNEIRDLILEINDWLTIKLNIGHKE